MTRFNVAKEERDDPPQKYLEESILPQPPSDPEYATITEYRQMAEIGSRSPSVTNPFYASTVSIAGRSNISEPPEYTQVIEPAFPPKQVPLGACNLGESGASHSLQDMRGLVSQEGMSRIATGGPTGGSQRAQTLTRSFNSHSSHNIPMHFLKRTNTMVNKPFPPPRSPGVQRRASQRSIPGEPYLAVETQPSNNLQSPLTQCIRALKGSDAEEPTMQRADDDEDDVGPDNYIILPKV